MYSGIVLWMVGKAEGFDLRLDHITYYDKVVHIMDSTYNPLLLQKAIDGINSLGLDQIGIEYMASYGWCFNYNCIPSDFFETADEARSEILEIIFNKEKT